MKFKETEELKKLLDKENQKIVVIPHKNPDGDAMGSCLTWVKYLRKKGHDAVVVTPTTYPEFLHWLPGNEEVVLFEDVEGNKGIELTENADIVCCLDFNSLSRIDKLGHYVHISPAKTVVIDHHLFPDDFADVIFSYTNICSTCQLVYMIIEDLGGKDLIDVEMGECIYTGIVTDTGSFKYRSTDKDTHRIAGEVMELGVDTEKVHREVYDNSTEDRLRLLGHLLLNNMEVLKDKRTAFFALTEEDMSRFNFQKGDAEGVVNYALSIKGIDMAAFFREAEHNQVKISFRSKGDLAVNTIASKYFEGGGHKNAAGGINHVGLEDAVTKFKSVLDEFI